MNEFFGDAEVKADLVYSRVVAIAVAKDPPGLEPRPPSPLPYLGPDRVTVSVRPRVLYAE